MDLVQALGTKIKPRRLSESALPCIKISAGWDGLREKQGLPFEIEQTNPIGSCKKLGPAFDFPHGQASRDFINISIPLCLTIGCPMFIRFLEDTDCQHHYWYNREPFNQWSNDDDYRRTSMQETFRAGTVLSAIEVRQDGTRRGYCRIVIDNGERDSFYSGVPWDRIEIFRLDPNSSSVGSD